MTDEKEKELKVLAKQCLSIIETSTLKDKEIQMYINSAISDLNRVNVDVEKNIEDSLIVDTIMMYVKSRFGNTDIAEKELCARAYKSNLNEILLSKQYLIKAMGDSNE